MRASLLLGPTALLVGTLTSWRAKPAASRIRNQPGQLSPANLASYRQTQNPILPAKFHKLFYKNPVPTHQTQPTQPTVGRVKIPLYRRTANH